MVNVPFRGLAEKGVLRDPAPYQLDLNAWSRANNIRFHGNAATSAPIFRTLKDALADTPKFAIAFRPQSGFDTVYWTGATGQKYAYANGSVTTVTEAGWSAVTDPRAWTGQFLADVLYLNHPSQVPVAMLQTATQFVTLTGWDATWRCRSLRAFGDYAIALNVTKGTNAHPSMVKWSDLTLAGLMPGSWDQNDPTTSAGENELEGLDTPLLDGLAMQNSFVLYTSDQVWGMAPSDNTFIFSFSRLFGDGGILAPNCAAEVAGKHYVFGPDDIYVHDGVSKLSIVDKRNKDAIYRNLNYLTSDLAFVSYFPKLGDVLFAYPSGDPDCVFKASGVGCNRGFVYSILTDTSYFIDLPNVTAATLANANTVLTYSDAAAALTYETTGGTYWDQEAAFLRSPIFTSQAQSGVLANSRILAFDFYARGYVAAPYCAEASAPCILERTGIDLDQLGSDLGTAKMARRMFPQVVNYGLETPVSIYVGSAMTPSGPIKWTGPISFDPVSQYKIDFKRSGRYLALRFTGDPTVDFAIVGFDLDVTPAGTR